MVSQPDDSQENDVLGAETAPDGSLRWPAPDRDSPQLGKFSGGYEPSTAIGALLRMEGHQGRSDEDVKAVTGIELKRPRRWHKIFERMGVFYPGDGKTKLGKLGRTLRDAAQPDGLKRVIAREALEVLSRYQFDNPIERSLPPGNTIHPYWAVLRAASKLEWKIHWDEVNRELMRLLSDAEVEGAVKRIKAARSKPEYERFIGKKSNDAGLLYSRCHPAETSAPEGKTPEGQLRDQRMTPFLKRVGFGELFLSSPGAAGKGYWTVPEGMRELVSDIVDHEPEAKAISNPQDWVEWFCEGSIKENRHLPIAPPLTVKRSPKDLTLSDLMASLASFDSELMFSDELLASIVAALRSGDGRNFIILRGVSGTGKSRLVAAVAKAVFGTADLSRPNYTMIEVRPDWTDSTPLIGYYDPISCRYIRTPFLDALVSADENNTPVFVCLDEMNLARVEYYLADCLSAMESGNKLILDTRGDDEAKSEVRWSENVFLFGTVNIDETTLSISDKVLDRAQVIDTSDIDISRAIDDWLAAAASLDESERQTVMSVLYGAWRALRKTDSHFGFRTAKSVIRFVEEAKSSSEGTLEVKKALDAQLCQKILTKLRGEGDHWSTALEELQSVLIPLGTECQAAKIVAKMRRDLEHLGSFQFWH